MTLGPVSDGVISPRDRLTDLLAQVCNQHQVEVIEQADPILIRVRGEGVRLMIPGEVLDVVMVKSADPIAELVEMIVRGIHVARTHTPTGVLS